MLNEFRSQLCKQHPSLPARVMRMQTPHGEVMTPCFMPVGTRAMLNYVTPHDLLANGSAIILGGNTYHMLVNPGMGVIEKIGGMHKMMGWHKSMLTDSGGFQVFSLSKRGNLCVVDDHGAHFKHPQTNQVIHLNPATSIQTQKIIGADIIMAFDECTPEDGGRERALAALERTHRWLQQSKIEYDKQPYSVYGHKQALFGIIQGGSFRDLREQSTAFINQMDVDGIAIGGEVIGFNMQKTCEIVDWIRGELPANKIRYTMGVGLQPQDLLDITARGIDIFDCVAPTRNARHGTLYYGELVATNDNEWLQFTSDIGTNHIHIKKSIYAQDEQPIMPHCSCYTCQHFSRAYLHYLFKNKLIAYVHLGSIHNIHVMQMVCERVRALINTIG